MLAGTRSGKSSWSPWWLHREIQRKGAGDYLLCAPSYKLLDKAAAPYLQNALGIKLGLGTVKGTGSSGHFAVSKEGEWKLWGATQDVPTRIVFGHADEPESLEAADFKAAVCDEAGQRRFKPESWEAIQRRLSIAQGRALFPTTPYSLNWLKTEVHDRAMRNLRGVGLPVDADYDCINFRSIDNPAFPLDEWERAKATLPGWKFDLFYNGIFTRPAGSIYDCFDPDLHKLPGKDFVLPAGWPIYCGIDFGAPHFRATFLYENMQTLTDGKLAGTKQFVAFAEYAPEESKKLADHVASMRKIIGKNHPDYCVGGAKSEGQWRAELAAAGWPTSPPDQPDVEIGIGRVYAMFANEPPRLYVMDTCPKLLEEIERYSRPVDEDGEPMEGIEDKDMFHSCDSIRYICQYIDRLGDGASIHIFDY